MNRRFMDQELKWGGINTRYLIYYLLKNLWIAITVGIMFYLTVTIISERSIHIEYSSSAIAAVYINKSAPLPENLELRMSVIESAKTVLSEGEYLRDIKIETGFDDVIVYSDVIDGTNLLSITCTSENPYHAYEFLRSILGNFKLITKYVSGDMALKTLTNATVPQNGRIIESSMPSPILAGIAGTFMVITLFCGFYILPLTYKGVNQIFRHYGEDILQIIPYHVDSIKPRQPFFICKKKTAAKEDSLVNAIKVLVLLIRQDIQAGKKVLYFTSAENSEGKHTLCRLLVKELANQGMNILYVDGSYLNVMSQNAFSDDMLIYSQDLGCEMIMDEKGTTSYSRDSIASLISRKRAETDAIIICGEAAKKTVPLTIWMSLSDLTYLIIKENTADIRQIDTLYEYLKNTPSAFGGCILNAFY